MCNENAEKDENVTGSNRLVISTGKTSMNTVLMAQLLSCAAGFCGEAVPILVCSGSQNGTRKSRS
jgi:hypothetical protein